MNLNTLLSKTKPRWADAGERFANLLAADNLDNPAKVYSEIKTFGFHHFMHGCTPRNENTIASALTTNFLIAGAAVQAHNRVAAIKMFSRAASPDPYKPLATGEAKFNVSPTDGSTAQTNPTNFQVGDSAINAVSINVNQYSESFKIRNSDLNDGIRMDDLIGAKMADLETKVAKALCANVTASNFITQAPVIVTQAGFGFGDVQQAWGQIKKASRKHLMLDGAAFANITNVPSLFQPTPVVPGGGWANLLGWDYVALHTEWSAAGSNIYGFACDPQAMACIAGVPAISYPDIPGSIISRAEVILPDVQIPIAAHSWFDTTTRTYWASLDMMFGSAPMDETIGVVIASGTPT